MMTADWQASIRWIAVDLDGTVLLPDKRISSYTLEILQTCRQKGLRLAVATSRSEASSRRYLEQLRPDLVVSCGGAVARKDGRVLYRRTMPADQTDRLIAAAVRHPAVQEIMVDTPSGYLVNWSEPPRSADYSHAIYRDFWEPVGEEVYKITLKISDREAAEQLAAEHPAWRLLSFSGEDYYRFAHPQATKLEALEAAMQREGLTASRVIAFGDDYNDQEMLMGCGCGVAMGNAVPAIQQIADAVCADHLHDGVAHWLEDHWLSSTAHDR